MNRGDEKSQCTGAEGGSTDSDADCTNHGDEKSQRPKGGKWMLQPTATLIVRTAAMIGGRRMLKPTAKLAGRTAGKDARTDSLADSMNRGDEKEPEAEGEQKDAPTNSDADSTNCVDDREQRPKESRRMLEPTATLTGRTAARRRARGQRGAGGCSNR